MGLIYNEITMVEALLSAVACGIIWIIYLEYKQRKLNKRKMSFKEAMDLAELPIITMYQEEDKYNFLLDTGSNDSFISESTSHRFKGIYGRKEQNIVGVGNDSVTTKCDTLLTYKDYSFECEFLVSAALNNAFDTIKQDTGVNIHGILGTKFLKKYRYIIDFNELVAYKK